MGGCGRVGAVVNPALAGMIRIAVAVRRVGAGKPRASGDDPPDMDFIDLKVE